MRLLVARASVDMPVGDGSAPVWSHDGHHLFFQDFLERGKPIYRVDTSTRDLVRLASIDDVLDVVDYRLIGLTPDDNPLITVQTSLPFAHHICASLCTEEQRFYVQLGDSTGDRTSAVTRCSTAQ
jgi:hypothetical protein